METLIEIGKVLTLYVTLPILITALIIRAAKKLHDRAQKD